MEYRVDIICFLSAIGLAILCAVLVSVWRGFAILTGLFMCVACVIFAYWRYKKYVNYRDAVAEARYRDAYVYAEENDTNFDPDQFYYSKRQERQIESRLRELKSMILIACVLVVASASVVVIGITAVL